MTDNMEFEAAWCDMVMAELLSRGAPIETEAEEAEDE